MLLTEAITVRVHLDKYEKDIDAVVAFITKYINKRAPTLRVKVASVGQTRSDKQKKTSATHGTFKWKIELKKYSREEYDWMSVAQHQQLYDLSKKAGLIKSKKCHNILKGHATPLDWLTLVARVAMPEAKTDNSSNESLFADEKPKAMQIIDGSSSQKGTVSSVCWKIAMSSIWAPSELLLLMVQFQVAN